MGWLSGAFKLVGGAATTGLAWGVGLGVAGAAYKGIQDLFGFGQQKSQEWSQGQAQACPRGCYNARGQYMRDASQDARLASLERRMAISEWRMARAQV